MSDVHHPPAMQFYIPEFLAGTSHFTVDEIGAYVLMLFYAWDNGGIPLDLGILARVCRVTPIRMGKLWQTIKPKWSPHPTDPDRLIQQRQERVRAESKAYRDRQSAAGRKSAERRFNHGLTTAEPVYQPQGNSPSPSLSPQETRSQEIDTNLRATLSPAFAFAEWFVREGLAVGAIPEHEALDIVAAAYPQIDAAERLLEAYGADEGRCRAVRFFVAKAARRVRASATIAGLLRVWDFDEIADAKSTPRNGRTPLANDRGSAMDDAIAKKTIHIGGDA